MVVQVAASTCDWNDCKGSVAHAKAGMSVASLHATGARKAVRLCFAEGDVQVHAHVPVLASSAHTTKRFLLCPLRLQLSGCSVLSLPLSPLLKALPSARPCGLRSRGLPRCQECVQTHTPAHTWVCMVCEIIENKLAHNGCAWHGYLSWIGARPDASSS